MSRKFAFLCGAGLMLVAQPALAATTVFDLTASDPAAGLGAGPFGTVTVTEGPGGTLQFVVSLASGYRIHDGNANHYAFAFKIAGDPAVTVSDLTGGFGAVNVGSGDNVSSPPFGSFYTAIDCAVCGSGWNGGFAGPLSFTVSSTSALSLASLGFNLVGGTPIYFTSDLVNANGNTGNIGATAATTAVPEPATWALMVAGFGGVGFAMRRRQKATRVRFA